MPAENSSLTDEALIDRLIELTERYRAAVSNRLDQPLVDSIKEELQAVQDEVRTRSKKNGIR